MHNSIKPIKAKTTAILSLIPIFFFKNKDAIKGTKTIYKAVRKPALPALVKPMAYCWILVAKKIIKPLIEETINNVLVLSSFFNKKAGNVIRKPIIKREPFNKKGPI